MVIASARTPVKEQNSDSHLVRDLFPAVYTTLSPQALGGLVLSNYNLKRVEQCLLWHRGLSDIYLIEAEECSYILRISHHHWRSRSEIEFELSFLDFLHEHNLPVAYPIPTIGNELFVTIPALEGDRYAALFPFAEGSVPVGDLDLTQGEIFGETLSKLHLVGKEFEFDEPSKVLSLEYLLDDSIKAIAPFLKHNFQDLDYLKNKVRDIKAELKELPQNRPYWTVCWGDPHSGNSHFTESNQIALFDFDQCGYGWRAFDIAKFLQVSLSAGMSRKVRDAFVKGYQTVSILTTKEINSLQALTQTAHIWNWAISIESAAVHCWSRLDSCYFRRRLEQLKRLDSANWQLF